MTFNIIEGNGILYFVDEQERAILTEAVSADDITYDERRGYVLSDGRNLDEITVPCVFDADADGYVPVGTTLDDIRAGYVK